jgi:hypothetical protein
LSPKVLLTTPYVAGLINQFPRAVITKCDDVQTGPRRLCRLLAMANKHRRPCAVSPERSGASNTRRVVSAPKLDRYLTAELHKRIGFEMIRLAAGYRLRRADAEGCNWSGNVTAIHGLRSPSSERIAAALRPIVGAARARFNLSE